MKLNNIPISDDYDNDYTLIRLGERGEFGAYALFSNGKFITTYACLSENDLYYATGLIEAHKEGQEIALIQDMDY